MPPFKLGLLALAGLVLAACQQEAGGDPMFPPIGGARPMAMPDTGQPVHIAPDVPINGSSTTALSAAVNDALMTNATPPGAATPQSTSTGNGITPEGNASVLAAQSQGEQGRQRGADTPAPARHVIIQPGQSPQAVSDVNIITYARETTNAVGQRLYRRPSIRRTISSSQCRKFSSVDDAQRNFLANGGPQDDPLNLDPDGDGFACRWSPEAYRALVLN